MDIKLEVGVKVFLKNRDGKYLLVKRSPNKYKGVRGTWDIVGGRINAGSSLIENLKREVLEETKLEIVFEPILLKAQDIILDSSRHIVRLSYLAEAKGELVLDTEENIDYKWLTIDEMKKQENLDIYVAEILKEDTYLNVR